MKELLTVALIATHLFVVAKRLPDWRNDKSIWVAAVEVDPLDPWSLNNAAHTAKKTDKRSIQWLMEFNTIKIPDWLPYLEREPYRVGIEGLRDSLRASGFEEDADKVNNKWNEIMIGHKLDVSYAPGSPKTSQTIRPYLLDRYAESWGGLIGMSVVFNASTIVTSKIYTKQMFTPVVLAPTSSAMTSVLLSICLPVSFNVEKVNKFNPNGWTLQETNKCARYTTFIPVIQRGIGINPNEALQFRPTKLGRYVVKYMIASKELRPYSSSFVVWVKAQ